MAQVTQQQCDNCGKLITGIHGMTKVHREFISIKGQLGMGVVDPETKWRDFYYLSPRSDADMSFCDEGCLHEYMMARLEIAKRKREQSLREEASMDQLYRDDPFNDPRIKNKGFRNDYEDPKKNFGLYN